MPDARHHPSCPAFRHVHPRRVLFDLRHLRQASSQPAVQNPFEVAAWIRKQSLASSAPHVPGCVVVNLPVNLITVSALIEDLQH